jgi:prevent-host-death family protein
MSISATEAQNNFGRVLDDAASEGVVYITKYDRPTAVVLSIREYNVLTAAAAADLEELTQDFDEMLDGMQAAEAAEGLDALFEMDRAALGDAALRGTHRRGTGGARRRTRGKRRTQD